MNTLVKWLASGVLAMSCAGGCLAAPVVANPALADNQAAQKAQGAALLKPFKMQLKSALRKGLAQGPEQAVLACQQQAPGIASGLSQGGVSMGRSSHKLRNPDNAPANWLKPVLADFQANPNAGPKVVALDEGLTGYVEPIKVQTMCLNCHGQSIEPGVQQRLQALYPQDKATGFREGDFRGVFWTVFRANKAD